MGDLSGGSGPPPQYPPPPWMKPCMVHVTAHNALLSNLGLGRCSNRSSINICDETVLETNNKDSEDDSFVDLDGAKVLELEDQEE